MRLVRSIVLYTAISFGANAALGADMAALDALRAGDMKKLNFHSDAKPLPEVALVDETGQARSLTEYRGKWVLVNFWATWCAPCRKELPSLDLLQTMLGGEDFTVATVATGRNAPQGIDRLFGELGIVHLDKWRDDGSVLARQIGIMGLPVTVILNPEGEEVARLQGEADWSSDSAQAILSALIDGGA